MSIGENIKKYREANNLTQVQLAENLGIDQSYITKVERGIKIPTIMLLQAMAKTLECTINDLIDEAGSA